MSLLGTLEQFSLGNVLRRVETHEKTGLLVIKQGSTWVELYFRAGRLLCIGPVRTTATLGERLLQDKVISPEALQETRSVLHADMQSETRVALELMNRNYCTREQLRSWAMQKALDVLQALLLWENGEIYFEEDRPAPSDRLLVSMSVSSLLQIATPASVPAQSTGSIAAVSVSLQPTQKAPATYSTVAFKGTQNAVPTRSENIQQVQQQSPTTSRLSAADISRLPTLMEASQFIEQDILADSPLVTSLPATEALAQVSFERSELASSSIQDEHGSSEVSFAALMEPDALSPSEQTIQAVPVMYPVPPKCVDTSFMRPEMVLMPVDFSGLREPNPQAQITPDQWRLLTCADGQTTLQDACQILHVDPTALRQVAGELVAEGIVHVGTPEQLQAQVASTAREATSSSWSNGYVAPGSAATTAAPWAASVPALPSSDVAGQFPFETESQWGNGGNGATFVPGQGWITTPQPLRPLQAGGPLAASHNTFVPASNDH